MSSSGSNITVTTKHVLAHLKSVKPYDGWTVEMKGTDAVRLLRRNIPVNETWFIDLALDSSKSVIGIKNKNNDKSAGILLIDPRGVPLRIEKRVVITNHTIQKASTNPSVKNSSPAITTATTTRRSSSTASTASTTLSDEENQKLITYAIYAIVGIVALKALASAMFVVYIVLFPVFIFYAISTCPTMESFDCKKELKRVLRGHHLPEDHPEKPRGWLSESLTRLQATITTELAAATGYEISMFPILNACIITTVRIPAVNVECYWIGIFGGWRYCFQREIEPTRRANTRTSSYKRD